MAKGKVQSKREWYRGRFATGWLILTNGLRRSSANWPRKGPVPIEGREDTEGSKRATRTAQMRSKWTLIPLAIIIVLAAGLTGRNAIYTWIDWNYRTENPHAELVPDSADLMVTIDLARLRDPQVIDALNGWRQRVSGTERADDVTPTASRWTGHDFSDDAIARWAGRRMTLMSGPWGDAFAIDAREKTEALAWLERNNEGWDGWLDGDIVWLANGEAAEQIAETKRYGLRTTIATTADYRRAREEHDMKGAQAEMFVRWRQVPQPWRERLTTAMDCAPNGWIATRVRADRDALRVQSVCRAPQRSWRAGRLAEAKDGAWEIPERSAVWFITSHPTSWQRIRERLEVGSPGSAELAGAVVGLLKSDDETSGLLGVTKQRACAHVCACAGACTRETAGEMPETRRKPTV